MSWKSFCQQYYFKHEPFFALDVSRMNVGAKELAKLDKSWSKAVAAMKDLEAGAIANPDENRMVGHYWLRNPDLAPSPALARNIKDTLQNVLAFAGRVHRAELTGQTGPFENLLVIGIGGSALGPQFVGEALGQGEQNKLRTYYLDNTDPDGMDRVLQSLSGQLGRTLTLVISKSGGTPETRNGMVETKATYERAGLSFAHHAVAVTGEGSALDQKAAREDWLARFPMWDWVGGRTSETAVVGLLPAALEGFDIEALLAGAAVMDEWTREAELARNPAGLLAAMWFFATNGKGEKDMVILPYKDRLHLFSKYMQQLVMESLGKEKDLDGQAVHQGIAVYGNKGSTDQHAYIQQLREGVPNFFAVFLEVLRDRDGVSLAVDDQGMTSGDYLHGFFLGTREALSSNGRPSLTITIEKVEARTVGMLIALFERAVGYYATLININAYHQPGVEAGKKAAATVLGLKKEVIAWLQENAGGGTPEFIATALGKPGDTEAVFKLVQHMAANPQFRVTREEDKSPLESIYRLA